jgi:hypothetical protein
MPNPLRSTMADLIALVRQMIADPAGQNQTFQDIDIQNRLDSSREDVRYEGLAIAPSIVNLPSTNNQPSTIFADYYSRYQWWESDAVLQGQGPNGAAWVALTPASSDYLVGHWQFELNVFMSGTVPGQLPPVFATGKVYDVNCAAADLLEFWAATLAGSYDVTVDGQTLRRSQLMQAKLTMAQHYRRLAKPKIAKQSRHDVMAPIGTRRMRLLDSDDLIKGA